MKILKEGMEIVNEKFVAEYVIRNITTNSVNVSGIVTEDAKYFSFHYRDYSTSS